LDLPAHGSVVVTFTLRTYRPGPFKDARAIFVDDGTLREIEVSVRGEAVENKDSGGIAKGG
jgi:hypothetical protein